MKKQMGIDKRLLQDYQPPLHSIAGKIGAYFDREFKEKLALQDLGFARFIIFGFLDNKLSLNQLITSFHSNIDCLYLLQDSKVSVERIHIFIEEHKILLLHHYKEISIVCETEYDPKRLEDYLSTLQMKKEQVDNDQQSIQQQQ